MALQSTKTHNNALKNLALFGSNFAIPKVLIRLRDSAENNAVVEFSVLKDELDVS